MENKPTTTQTAAPNKLEMIKSATLAKAQETINTALGLKERVSKIKITNDTELGMANQLLSNVNQHYKAVEAKRKEVKDPYLKAGKIIDEVFNMAIIPLEEAIASGKKCLTDWNVLQKQKLAEQQAVIDKEINMIQNMDKQLSDKADACETPEKCIALVASIEKNFPSLDSFPNYRKEAEEVKTRYISALTVKASSLEKLIKGGAGSTQAAVNIVKTEQEVAIKVEEAKVQIEEKKIEITAAAIANAAISNTRKSWKFAVADHTKIELVPAQFLQLNEAAVKVWMQKNKADIKDGDIHNGIKFFLVETPVIK